MDNYRRSWLFAIVITLMGVSFALGRNSVHTENKARVYTEIQRENFAQVCVVHQPCRIYIEIDPNLEPGSFSNVTFEGDGDLDMR